MGILGENERTTARGWNRRDPRTYEGILKGQQGSSYIYILILNDYNRS